MKRRDFLRGSLLGFGALASAQLASLPVAAQEDEDMKEGPLELKGLIKNIHDPVIIKHEGDGAYYLFSTGDRVPVKRSPDLHTWLVAPGGVALLQPPQEIFDYVPGAIDMWAPDISYYNDRYHLYYSVSTFGSNVSAIGLATNKTLRQADDDFEWVDQGIVVKSQRTDFYNAIDPNLVLDPAGTPWLSFGSFWGGIKLLELNYETGLPAEEAPTLYSLATREDNSRSVEAPFIIHQGDYYYLFVSYDFCCRGADSTYNVRVGRSEDVKGPYVDRDDVPMMEGGGTQITFPTDRWRGPGHNSILRDGDKDYIVYHAYDATQGGIPTLRIERLLWDDDGWPYLVSMVPES